MESENTTLTDEPTTASSGDPETQTGAVPDDGPPADHTGTSGAEGDTAHEPTGETAASETSVQAAPDAPEVTFADLGLSDKVLRAVTEAGYTTPTAIQAAAIPSALQGRDILGLAQTGTGKTAGFTLPMIDILSKGRGRARMPRSLILAPTRELAMQVSESFEKYGKYQKLTMALLIGGVSFADQEAKLDRGVDVLVATPGRLLDHFERGKVLLTGVQVLVIDEADRMLDMGFIPDIERIVKLTPFTRQTLFFSATMPDEINRLTQQFLQNPERIEVAKTSSTAETVTQAVCQVRSDDKREALRQLIRSNDIQNAIIFCNRKRDVSIVFKSLSKHGFDVAALHGDLDQRVRMQVLDQFRKGNIKLLVASDVAARGLDIPEVSHVFNFDVPFNSEDYVHRIGRTGRAGRDGAAYMIATKAERKYIGAIEEMIGKPIPTMTIEGLGLDGSDTDEDDGDGRSGRSRRGGSRSGRGGRGRSSRAKADAAPSPDTDDQPKRAPRADTADEASSDDTRRDAVADQDSGPRSDDDRSRRARPKRSRDQDRSDDRTKARGGRGGRGRRRRDDDDDEPVIGLGDHVPAFLLRPVRIPKATPDQTGSDKSADPGDAEERDSDDYPLAKTG